MNTDVQRGALRRATLVLALGTVLIAAALVAGLAIAHVHEFHNLVRIDSALTGSGGDGVYRGTIASPKGACERPREVQVWNASVLPNVRVARGRSNAVGDWKAIGSPIPNGDKAYALLETKVLRDPDHTCRVARSAKRAYPYP